jgi:hypothetical protein
MFKYIYSKINWSSKYTFPVIVFLVLIFLTIFKISGSSVGPFYDTYFNGKDSSSLLAGQPRGVRTDEWLVTTQLTIAQKSAGFPVVNNNIGQGKDMSLISDVPYIEWSAFFKPQNFSFLVIPLENAFAFKWWFLLATLLISTYFLALRFMPNRKLYAVLISTVFSFSPFIFWWYQSITIMPIVWIIVVILFTMRILDNRRLSIFNKLNTKKSNLLSNILLVAGLSYSAVAFGLVLYPAFQIPLTIVAIFFLIGYWLNLEQNKNKRNNKLTLRALMPVIVAGLIALSVIASFMLTRIDAIRDISNTVYPGSRNVESGDIAAKHILSLVSFDQYRLLDDNVQNSFQGVVKSNQSEMSSFNVLSFLFVIPLLLLGIWKWIKFRKIDWIIVGLLLGNAVIYSHLLIPIFTPVSKIFFLQAVPAIRLVIGMGLLGVLSLIYIVHTVQNYKTALKPFYKPFGIIYTLSLVILYAAGVIYIQKKFPGLIGDLRIIALLGIFYISSIVCTILPRPLIGLAALSIMSVFFTATIQPIYTGLGPISDNHVVNTIQQLSNEDSTWGVNDDILLENLPTIANRKNITGTQFSPDNEYWDSIQDDDTDQIYNRYAHILLSDTQQEQLHLVQADYFTAKISCTNLIGKTVTHILSNKPLKYPCYNLVNQINFPARTIYFYELH